jgi:hypothetical protein
MQHQNEKGTKIQAMVGMCNANPTKTCGNANPTKTCGNTNPTKTCGERMCSELSK